MEAAKEFYLKLMDFNNKTASFIKKLIAKKCMKGKTAAESYRMLREAYGEDAPSQDTCERWFRRFKNGDFDIADKEHGKPPKKYEDAELQALLDKGDAQTQQQLAEQLGVSRQAVSNRLRQTGKIKLPKKEIN